MIMDNQQLSSIMIQLLNKCTLYICEVIIMIMNKKTNVK